MLTILKLVRNTFQQMRSELTPAQIAVGTFLGAVAGLTPFGAHLVLLFTLALLVNCSMAAFLLVAGALKPLGLALGGASFALGASLLQGGGLKAVQDQTLKAIQTGDTKGLQEAVRKAQADVKSLPDAKKDLEQKKDSLKDALDLFPKKK